MRQLSPSAAITWSGRATSSSRPEGFSAGRCYRKLLVAALLCARPSLSTVIGRRTNGSVESRTRAASNSARRACRSSCLTCFAGTTRLPEMSFRPSGRWHETRRRTLCRSGPTTQQDRWENQPGHTPFTLGCVIAALLVAAQLADEQGESGIAVYLRETADAWNAAIESWLYITDTALSKRLGIEGYYLRIVPYEKEDHTPRSIAG